MAKEILVTDSLFIFDEHIKELEDAGYKVVRLDKPNATEEELCEIVKGKVGYILGGIEKVTEKVIDAADELKVISVTGIGYPVFVPAWEYAINKGILLSNTPDGPTQEVAEWAITACLMMNRRFLEVGIVGKEGFLVTKGIESQRDGIIGLGRIGTRISEMLQVFKPASISYFSRSRKPDAESRLGLSFQDLSSLMQESDIVFVTLADEAKNFLGQSELSFMKQDALLVNITHPGIIDQDALFEVLKAGLIRAISDYPMSEQFNSLPFSHWYSMNGSNTVTEAGAKLMSDMVTKSMINLLTSGHDQYKISA